MAFINFGMANTLAQAKASTNKNKLFFPTDSKKIVIDGKEYGGIDGVDIESKNSMYGVVGNGNNITDGVAAIKGIKGNTIAWNQLLKENKLVDMGLPSGTLWASCNIDITQPDGFAASPFQYDCSFFSWGNVDGHNPISVSAFDYNWGSVNQQSPWYEGQPYGNTPGNTLTGNIPVGDNYDAARANLGSLWRMPTNANYGELFSNIIYINADGTEVDTTKTDKRVTVNGIVGLYIQSKINGARLFFAASGDGTGTSRNNRGARGRYWSSSWNSGRNARYLYFGSDGVNPQSIDYRYYGFPVRAVISKSDLIQDGKRGHKFALSSNNANITDVTLTYGSNKEPTSVAQFEADYQRWFGKTLTYEPYDAGSLRNVMMSAIKTTGFNQYNPTTGKANVFAGITYYIGGTYSTLTINGEIIAPINRKFTPSVNGEVVVSGGDNTTVINVSNDAINGQYKPYWNSTKSIPVTQLTGKLNGQGESVTIFPDGMKSAGNIRDEIFVDNGVVKAIKRVGAVDLGSLTWIKASGTLPRYSSNGLANIIKIPATSDVVANIICPIYRTYNFNVVYEANIDKTTAVIDNSSSGKGNITCMNSSYTTVSAFRTAMDGVMLYYELAEPQVYVLDDDVLPLMYKVDELGTEQVLPACTDEAPCCAPELDIRYRITPVEVLDNFSKVTNNKQVKAVADNARIEDRIVTWSSDGATIKDGGYKITDLLPTRLTLEWNDNENAIVIDSVSNYKQVPNSVVCRYLNLIMQMSFCDDTNAAKLIGTFVATTDFIDAFEIVSGITLVEDTIYLLQINVNWDPVSIKGTDTICIKTVDGTCIYPGGDDSSSSGSGSESGSKPYDD